MGVGVEKELNREHGVAWADFWEPHVCGVLLLCGRKVEFSMLLSLVVLLSCIEHCMAEHCTTEMVEWFSLSLSILSASSS